MKRLVLFLCFGLGVACATDVSAQPAPTARPNTNQFIGPVLPTNRPPAFRRGPAPTGEARPPAGSVPALPTVRGASNTTSGVTAPVPTRSVAAPLGNQSPASLAATNAATRLSNAVVTAAPVGSNAAPAAVSTTLPTASAAIPPNLAGTPDANAQLAPAQAAPGLAAPAQPTATVPQATPPALQGTTQPAQLPGLTPAATPNPAVPPTLAPGPLPLAAPAVAQAVAPEPRDVDLNFPNAPLESVLKFYAEMTGRTILRPAMLPGNQSISLVSNGRLTRSEAIQALHTVLAMNGVTVLPEGDRFAKAVPSAQALQEGAPFSKIPANDLPEAGQFVTQVVQVTNVLPSELTQILTPFAKTPQGIVPIDSSQTLVLRDFAANVKRMMEVIAKVDIEPPADYKLEVIPIKFGKVDEIYDVMGSLVGTGAGGTTSGAAARAPGTAGTTRGRGSSVRRSSSAMGGSMGGNSMSRGGLQQRGQLGQNAQGQQPGQQTSFQQRLAQLVNRAASGGESQLLQDARIIPDSRANSLVVYANKHDMDVITNVVAKLDVMLAQVLIESAIIDVDLNKNSDFGVSFAQRPKTAGDWTGAGGINNAKDFWGSLSNFPSSLNGGLTYFANYKGDLEMTVKAIANKGTVTVLQKPRILTTHAVPASFFNGKTVPYITSSYYGGVGYGNSSSYQQLEVGIGLEVTPYITPDNLVLMEVNQTIDEISGSVKIDNNDVPTTTSRTASSTVSVRNGETIMLGGYIRSSKTRTRGGVPGLMNVPLVGALFRSNHSESDRSELVVLIRPTVLTTPEAAAKQVEIEKENLPGARLAEREYYETEEAVKRAADKEIKAKDSSKKKGNKQSDDFY